jgi:hypothetical protein
MGSRPGSNDFGAVKPKEQTARPAFRLAILTGCVTPSRSAPRQQKIIIMQSSVTLTSSISVLRVWLEFAGNAEPVRAPGLEPGPND